MFRRSWTGCSAVKSAQELIPDRVLILKLEYTSVTEGCPFRGRFAGNPRYNIISGNFIIVLHPLNNEETLRFAQGDNLLFGQPFIYVVSMFKFAGDLRKRALHHLWGWHRSQRVSHAGGVYHPG